jgi:hypothetical protein
MTQAGTPPPRTVIGNPSQAVGLGQNYFSVFNILRVGTKKRAFQVKKPIKNIEHAPSDGPHAMVRLLARVIGVPERGLPSDRYPDPIEQATVLGAVKSSPPPHSILYGV